MADRNVEIALRIRSDLKQALSDVKELETELRATGSAGKTAGDGLGAVSRGSDQAVRSTRELNQQLRTIPAQAQSVNATLSQLRNVIGTVFAVHQIEDFTRSMVEANVEAQRIHFTLQQVFGEAGANEQFKFVSEQAARLGLDLQSAAEGYAQLAASAQNTGLTTETLQKLFVGLSESATVLHSSTQQVNGVFVQLAQGMSLGRLQMQDIRAIAQNLPGTMTLVSEAAKRMGIDFNDALQNGGIPAIQFLDTFADVLHERFGGQAVEASHSLNAELNRLKSTLFETKTQGVDFADSFADSLRDLNGELNDPGIRSGLQALIGDVGKIISLMVEAAAKTGSFINAMQDLAGFQLDQHVGGEASYDAALNQLQLLKEEQQRRANESRASRAARAGRGVATAALDVLAPGVAFAGDVDQQLQNVQSGAFATLSDSDIAARIKKLQDETAAYRNDTAAAAENAKTTGKGKTGTGGTGTQPPATPTTPTGGGDSAAARIARDATAAQQDLLNTIVAMQAQLDPTAAVWAHYNDAVEKANEDAAKAKLAHGADAEAIDAQRDAVVALAGKMRDAALDEMVEKDRQAWESLRRSMESPIEAKIDDAIAKIQKLNEAMATGVGNADEYHELLREVGENAVTDLPQYQGLDATVGGQYSELQKNYQAELDLEAAYTSQKQALRSKFREDDAAQEEAYQAALAKLDDQHSKESLRIQQSRGQLQLQTASNIFGQLATLSSSHNKRIAEIGKAAAIAQTIINTYQSATEAYASLASIPYIGPALGAAAAAAAIAAGLANVAAIRSQPTGGYAEGGLIRGPGTPTSDSIHILASDKEFMQPAAAVDYYGVDFMEAVRSRSLPRFADGGLIGANPFYDAPRLSAPATPGMRLTPAGAGAAGGNGDAGTTHIHVWDINDAWERVSQLPAAQKWVIHVVGDNPRTIQGQWRR